MRLLLFSALPFRGHKESESSRRKGLLINFLKFHVEKDDNLGKVILKNALGIHIMTSPDIQKELQILVQKKL